MSGFEDDDFFDEKEGEEEGPEEPAEAAAGPEEDEDDRAPAAKKARGKKARSDDEGDDEEYGDYDDMEEEREVKKAPPPVKENKFMRFTGKITPLGRDEKNVINTLQIQSLDDSKVYPIEMNEIGKQLIKRCFHELYVTGELVPRGDKKFILVVKSFL